MDRLLSTNIPTSYSTDLQALKRISITLTIVAVMFLLGSSIRTANEDAFNGAVLFIVVLGELWTGLPFLARRWKINAANDVLENEYTEDSDYESFEQIERAES